MKDTVIFVTFANNFPVQKIADCFNMYGDINIVKSTDQTAFIEYSFIDKDHVKSGKLDDLILKLKADKKIKTMIKSICKYDKAERFTCDKYDTIINS